MHADLDAFYASVEQRDNPALQNMPMAVGTGIILSASYQARAMGVKTTMNVQVAKQYCPGLVTVEPRMEAYDSASQEVFEIFDDTTPYVEALSIDEAFLEVGGLRKIVGPPIEVAQILRNRIAGETGLPISVGIARTKFLAKVASGASKPDGLLLVEPDSELEFLHPLPVRSLWGVGKVAEGKLLAKGIATVGEVANAGITKLEQILGKSSGEHLYNLANNIDNRQVTKTKRRQSIGAQQALSPKNMNYAEIETLLIALVDRVTKRLRDGNRLAKTVMLRFRFGDFRSDTRSVSVADETDSTPELLAIARNILRNRRPEIETSGLTLIGFTLANLSTGEGIQQALDFTNNASPKLDIALDAVKDRFGTNSIGRAGLLSYEESVHTPVIPDTPD